MEKIKILPAKQNLFKNTTRIIKDIGMLVLLLLIVLLISSFFPLGLATLRILMIGCVIFSLYIYARRNAVFNAAEKTDTKK